MPISRVNRQIRVRFQIRGYLVLHLLYQGSHPGWREGQQVGLVTYEWKTSRKVQDRSKCSSPIAHCR